MDEVFVIEVARDIWREGSEHLVNLPGRRQGGEAAQEGFVAGARRRAGADGLHKLWCGFSAGPHPTAVLTKEMRGAKKPQLSRALLWGERWPVGFWQDVIACFSGISWKLDFACPALQLCTSHMGNGCASRS